MANILTIDRLGELQSREVKTITDTDDETILFPEQKDLMVRANGWVILFYLSGPMIFGVSKAIAHEHGAMKDADVPILDLSDVPLLGVTASPAIENAIKDALDKGLRVFIVGATGKIKRRLKKLGIFGRLPSEHLLMDRTETLRKALFFVNEAANDGFTSGSPANSAALSNSFPGRLTGFCN